MGDHPVCAAGSVASMGYLEPVWDVLSGADVVITSGGWSAVADVVASGAALVVVPEERPFDEQRLRAEALDRAAVCARYELPADREGDVAVLAEQNVVIGGAAAEHDLSALSDARLRSHGGLSEARVPFILSAPLNASYRQKAAQGLKSHQIFDFAINGVRGDAHA